MFKFDEYYVDNNDHTITYYFQNEETRERLIISAPLKDGYGDFANAKIPDTTISAEEIKELFEKANELALRDRIEKVFDEEGISYDISNADGAYIEFWTDTAGQDVYVDIFFDGTYKDYIEKFWEYADNYDVDEEVELYAEIRGQRGVPSSFRTLLEDCEEAKQTLIDIGEQLLKLLR